MHDSTGEHDQPLRGGCILVTGADVGIGQAVAAAAAAAGADVAVHHPPSGPGPAETIALVERAGQTAVPIEGDLGDPATCRAVVDQAVDRLGRLDGLVNNAGITRTVPFTEVDPELFSTLLSINFGGQFFCAQRAATHLADRGGSIVNISSIHASRGYQHSTVYAGAKGAIEAWTRTAAIELGPAIRVNAVAPGLIETPRIIQETTDEARQRFGARSPVGRIGLPADVADVVIFLLSNASRYMTGQIVHVDGGATAH